ncbi:LysR family transcriptional regulator [Duganella sp. Leaf126]|uniref:LysR family transcriptional regulator n=1 Tax=Duganella sp. Leaf126 TaxID=1736266 RepID=UPI0006F93D2A|nr:LysR family transcriptional regulator [Duganella sp. Leaf126]KQQ32927.1 LysR family transcriptional regulator [Duganella sp. Leaf126]
MATGSALNYKHLRYFWMVARSGSIAKAAEQLHLTPQSISGQLSEFADALGVELFRRVGRRLELTDTGSRVLRHAEDIFSAGDALLDVVRDQSATKAGSFRIGVSDSVSKAVACRLVAPALSLAEPTRLICREGRLAALLADMAIHRLDMIIADRPMPSHLSVRGYNHLLGESELGVFAAPALASTLTGDFPGCLNQMPLLLPGEDFAVRAKLMQWLHTHVPRLHVVGEFDDSAMIKAFGASGAGLFFAPLAIAETLTDTTDRASGMVLVGTIPALREQVYAITTERRLSHPATQAISQAARQTFTS